MNAIIAPDLELTRLPRRAEIGDYDWFDLEHAGTQVGKLRCRVESDRLTVFSIMVYPEYEKHGFARAVIEHFQHEHRSIVADRVRFTARDFWCKLGFVPEGEDTFVWKTPGS
jgi:GNAT superfamily N-acetyltransferase